LDAGAGVAPA